MYFPCVCSSLVPLFVWGYCCDTGSPSRPHPTLSLRSSVTAAVLWHQNDLFTPSSCERFVLCCLLSPPPPKHSLAHVPSPNSCLSVMSVNDIGPQLQPEWFQRGGKKFRSDFFHTASPPLLIPLIGSSMEITRGMIGSTGSRRLRGFPQPLILPPWPPESKKAAD